jgi:hypothetical protein
MFPTPLSTVLSKIIALKPNTSKLTEIRIDMEGKWYALDVAALLAPLKEDSTLECLDLGCLETVARVNELVSSIPRLRGLKEIACGLSENTDEHKRLLKNAVRQNWSLEKVSCVEFPDDDSDADSDGDDEGDVVGDEDDDELTTVQSYCDRNITVPQLIANPDAVPLYVWPIILESVREYEYTYDALFRSLMALGDRVGNKDIEEVTDSKCNCVC